MPFTPEDSSTWKILQFQGQSSTSHHLGYTNRCSCRTSLVDWELFILYRGRFSRFESSGYPNNQHCTQPGSLSTSNRRSMVCLCKQSCNKNSHVLQEFCAFCFSMHNLSWECLQLCSLFPYWGSFCSILQQCWCLKPTLLVWKRRYTINSLANMLFRTRATGCINF